MYLSFLIHTFLQSQAQNTNMALTTDHRNIHNLTKRIFTLAIVRTWNLTCLDCTPGYGGVVSWTIHNRAHVTNFKTEFVTRVHVTIAIDNEITIATSISRNQTEFDFWWFSRHRVVTLPVKNMSHCHVNLWSWHYGSTSQRTNGETNGCVSFIQGLFHVGLMGDSPCFVIINFRSLSKISLLIRQSSPGLQRQGG